MKNGYLVASLVLFSASFVHAYDGTNCRAAGNCWEPKPNYPANVAGSKYDPKHDPVEIAKQGNSIKEMEARNAKRVENQAKTGVFKFDVK